MSGNKIMHVIFMFMTLLSLQGFSQSYPCFNAEIKVSINGLSFDAMEPFLSPDGNTLFFNSLNSGGNTNLYYASRINDSTFNFDGGLNGCLDTSANHLDAVPSIDDLNNFYWVSLRNYPNQMENLHKGSYSNGSVTNISRVHGDFNLNLFGWIIMDAAVNRQGDLLYYCNTYFDFINNSCGQGVPCYSKLGIAQKINDSTFNKLINSNNILNNVNDTNYLIYAPQISPDGLELYFTRLLRNTINTEICVAVRNTISDNFSLPTVIHSNYGFISEAATLSTDKQKLYYHQKNENGIFKIFLRYRNNISNISHINTMHQIQTIRITKNKFQFILPDLSEKYEIDVHTIIGQNIMHITNSIIDLSNFKPGFYLALIKQKNKFYSVVICNY